MEYMHIAAAFSRKIQFKTFKFSIYGALHYSAEQDKKRIILKKIIYILISSIEIYGNPSPVLLFTALLSLEQYLWYEIVTHRSILYSFSLNQIMLLLYYYYYYIFVITAVDQILSENVANSFYTWLLYLTYNLLYYSIKRKRNVFTPSSF